MTNNSELPPYAILCDPTHCEDCAQQVKQVEASLTSKLPPVEEVRKVCDRLCIDDLCRNNPESTLCGGSFCSQCRDRLLSGNDICEDCDETSYQNYDDSYEGLL